MLCRIGLPCLGLWHVYALRHERAARRPLRDEQGHIEGAFGISIDVTEREKARAEVETKVSLIERQ